MALGNRHCQLPRCHNLWPMLIMCNRGRTNDYGKCRFHPSIQLYLLNRNGKWVEIMKDCPLCLAFKMKSISCKSNPILATPKKSSRFSELKDGDELPSSAAIKDTKASSSTSCVIPVTYDRLAIQFPPLPLSTTRHKDSDFFDTTLAVCRMNDEVCYVTEQNDCLRPTHVNRLIKEANQSMRLLTRSNSQPTKSTRTSRFSRSEDDHSRHRLSKYDVHVSCIGRRSSTGSDFTAPSLSASSTSQGSDRSSFSSLKTQGKCKTVSCSKCAFEEVQRLRQQILLELHQDNLDAITKGDEYILNILTCSEKDLKKIVRSSCEIDRSDYTDSTCEIDRSDRTNDTHRSEGQSSKGSRRRVSFAARDDIMCYQSPIAFDP